MANMPRPSIYPAEWTYITDDAAGNPVYQLIDAAGSVKEWAIDPSGQIIWHNDARQFGVADLQVYIDPAVIAPAPVQPSPAPFVRVYAQPTPVVPIVTSGSVATATPIVKTTPFTAANTPKTSSAILWGVLILGALWVMSER
jgi:hypothetical protein